MPVEQYKQVIICNTFRLCKRVTGRAVTQLGKIQSLVLDGSLNSSTLQYEQYFSFFYKI